MAGSRRMSVKSVLVAVVVLAVASQAIRPARTNPPVDPARTLDAHAAVTPDVHAILTRACQDCHSDETVWPWYTNVAPASWLVISHVNDGRRHLNLSAWTTYDTPKAAKKLNEICEHVRDGEMPLTSYVWMHSNAALSGDDVTTLCAWTARERTRLGVAPSESDDEPRRH